MASEGCLPSMTTWHERTSRRAPALDANVWRVWGKYNSHMRRAAIGTSLCTVGLHLLPWIQGGIRMRTFTCVYHRCLTGGPVAGGCAALEAAPPPPPPSRWYLSRFPLSPCIYGKKHVDIGSAASIRAHDLCQVKNERGLLRRCAASPTAAAAAHGSPCTQHVMAAVAR